MFHFGGRVSFGMDVGYFLEFERAFKGYRVVPSASEVETVAGIGECAGDVLYLVVLLQDFLDFFRYAGHFGKDFVVFLRVGCSADFSECESQHDQNGDLSGECFG